jgi:hypothetical protein
MQQLSFGHMERHCWPFLLVAVHQLRRWYSRTGCRSIERGHRMSPLQRRFLLPRRYERSCLCTGRLLSHRHQHGESALCTWILLCQHHEQPTVRCWSLRCDDGIERVGGLYAVQRGEIRKRDRRAVQ